MGLTRVARQPGAKAAANAVSKSSRAAAARLSGSMGLTPTSMPVTGRARMRLRTKPAAMPMQASFVACCRTERRMIPLSAQKAKRMPISNVRCATE